MESAEVFIETTGECQKIQSPEDIVKEIDRAFKKFIKSSKVSKDLEESVIHELAILKKKLYKKIKRI